MLHILSINLSKSYKFSAGAFDDYSSASSYGSPVKRRDPKFKGSPHITEELLKDLLSAALNAAGFSERQRWELSEATDFARHHFRISPLSQWWPFEVLGRKPNIDEDVVEVSMGSFRFCDGSCLVTLLLIDHGSTVLCGRHRQQSTHSTQRGTLWWDRTYHGEH